MNFYWMKCWKFTKNSDIEIKGEIDGKISLYSYCIDCGFKQFETTDYEKISNLLNYLNYIETMLWYCLKCWKKTTESKSQ